jgi:hypothetical protein
VHHTALFARFCMQKLLSQAQLPSGEVDGPVQWGGQMVAEKS